MEFNHQIVSYEPKLQNHEQEGIIILKKFRISHHHDGIQICLVAQRQDYRLKQNNLKRKLMTKLDRWYSKIFF